MSARYPFGSIAEIPLDLIAGGTGLVGATPTIAIQRRREGQWYDALAERFIPVLVEHVMTEVDPVHLPGRYVFAFPHAHDLLRSTEFLAKLRNGDSHLEYLAIAFGPLPSVAAPDLCSIQGTIFGIDGRALPSAVVRATLIPVLKDLLGRGYEADRMISTTTNSEGFFDLPVIRGALLRLEIPAIGYDRRVRVPDATQVLFTEL